MKKVLLISAATAVAVPAGYCYSVSRRPTEQKLHIVIDLDNTILQTYEVKHFKNLNHSTIMKHDRVILDEPNVTDKGYYVWHRPFAHCSLWFLNKLFVVHMFTAATKDYGEACLDGFPNLFVNKKFYRESVTKKDSHGKDITLITDGKAVLVDDQLRNRTGEQEFYHIPPFTRLNRFDFELLKLCVWTVKWNIEHDVKQVQLK